MAITHETVVLPERYANRIFWFSYLFLVNSLYGFYYHLDDLALIYLIGMITSLNYWRLSRYNIIRKLDIIWINGGGLYHFGYLSLLDNPNQITYKYLYLFFITLGLGSYGCSMYYIRYSKYISCHYHLATHFFGHLAHHVLYRGLTSLCLSPNTYLV